jgi:hypothetical protein
MLLRQESGDHSLADYLKSTARRPNKDTIPRSTIICRNGLERRVAVPHNPQSMERNAMHAVATDEFARGWPVAVIMRRLKLDHPYADVAWSAHEIVHDSFADCPMHCVIAESGRERQVLFRGFRLGLHVPEAAGYHMNITSPEPKVFVLWRMHGDDACPELLTVSYDEGARWADSGEQVDGVALPRELLTWVAQFVDRHYRPEPELPRRRKRRREADHE